MDVLLWVHYFSTICYRNWTIRSAKVKIKKIIIVIIIKIIIIIVIIIKHN